MDMLPNRVEAVDRDFLTFELERMSKEDKELLTIIAEKKITGLTNPHNSIVLWCIGATEEFNPLQERSDMKGGSAPDIDMDFDSLGRDRAIQRVAEDWGRDNTANIAAYGTFKPKSITAKYLTAINKPELISDIRSKIPPAKYGFEASWEKIIADQKEKGGITIAEKYPEFFEDALKLEDMVIIQAMHAAGIVVSNDPIRNHLPTMTSKKAERITQYDKIEVEELGLLKFDFLGIENLSIIKEAKRLIEQNHNIKLDIWNLPDGDLPTYQAMWDGKLAGVFQFETSGSIKELTRKARPQSIDQLSDLTSLHRPGPMENKFHIRYTENSSEMESPRGMPDDLAAILKKTRYVLIYQETIMKICHELAGFTLQEADTVRAALGKKDLKKLEKMEPKFMTGIMKAGWSEEYAKHFWKELQSFASYCFNAAHAVSYSYITYACAYLKRTYPLEFFAALLAVRAQTLQPKKWAVKCPEYVQDAKYFGIEVVPPSINYSEAGSVGRDSKIFFGFSGIRDVGDTTIQSIINARGNAPFKSVVDFLARINRQKVNTKAFQALVKAGCFDRMGYARQNLLDATEALYGYFQAMIDHQTRELEILERTRAQEALEPILTKKAELKARQKKGLTIEEEEWLELNKATRKLVDLKPKPIPIEPVIPRSKQIKLTLEQIMEQAHYIGCYTGIHPATLIPGSRTFLESTIDGDHAQFAGIIASVKEIVTKAKKEKMAFIEFDDGTEMVEAVCFPRQWAKQPVAPGDLVYITGRIEVKESEESEDEEQEAKKVLIPQQIEIYRRAQLE